VPEPIAETVRKSELAWRTLGLRIRSVTPAQLARGGLIALAVGAFGWLLTSAWSQLLPFQLGLVLAYITMPIVNAFDRVMPRWIAASLVVVMELGAILLLIGVLVPPLTTEVTALLATLPDVTHVQTWLAQVREQLQALPPPIQELLRNGVEQLSNNVRSNALGYVEGVLQIAIATLLGLFGTLGFVIGFLGIPTWLVAVMSDQKAGVRAINRVVPAAAQPDFWAVVRILDRTFSAFVRGQVLFGIVTAVAIGLGLAVLERLGLATGEPRLLLAAIAGVAQLIPTLGPILGAIPAVGVGLAQSPTAAVATLGMFALVQLLLGTFVAPLVADRYVDIHPAVFVILLVLLSQFGFVWVLLAAPLSIVVRDLFLYAYGRLSEPPRPAGVAPGERAVAPVTPRLLRSSREVAHG
jgi:predicted PurR-regulated permease PerM